MFYGLSNLKEIDFSDFDFSHVSTMKYMFKDCTGLIQINFGNIKTSTVENMENLFENCYQLTSINLTKFDTSSVSTFSQMFCNCSSIKSIDASSFNTKNTVKMNYLFAYCTQLISINLSFFDISNAKNIQGMFLSCENIKYIDLQHFNDNSLDNIAYVLKNCTKLAFLNLKYMNIKNIDTFYFNKYLGNYSSKIKFCIEESHTKNILLDEKNNDCSNLCFQENVIFDIEKGTCVCNYYFKFEYNTKCYHECPSDTIQIFTGRYICEIIIPENYYLNNITKYNTNFIKYNARLIKLFLKTFEIKRLLYPGERQGGGLGGGMEDKHHQLTSINIINEHPENPEIGLPPEAPEDPDSPEGPEIAEPPEAPEDPETYQAGTQIKTDIVCYSTCQTCEQPGNDLDHNCKTCKSEYLYKYNNNCYS